MMEVFETASTRNIYKSSSYLTGNTLRLRYKAQPVNAVSSVGIATGYGLDDQGEREFESR
jgi:hypothetical protein